LPMAIKHEYARDGAQLNEGHLSTGSTRFEFERDLLHQFEELFGGERSKEREIMALRRARQFVVGRAALGRETVPRRCGTSGKRSAARARRRQRPSGGWSGRLPPRRSLMGSTPDCGARACSAGSCSRNALHGSVSPARLGAASAVRFRSGRKHDGLALSFKRQRCRGSRRLLMPSANPVSDPFPRRLFDPTVGEIGHGDDHRQVHQIGDIAVP